MRGAAGNGGPYRDNLLLTFCRRVSTALALRQNLSSVAACSSAGRYRVVRVGSSTLTHRKPRRSYLRCVAGRGEAFGSTRLPGVTGRRFGWGWKVRFAPNAAPRDMKTFSDTFSIQDNLPQTVANTPRTVV